MDAYFQQNTHLWMLDCFGSKIAEDRTERADRFVEEALELAQSTGWTKDRAHALADYVFARPAGEIEQEVGGVAVTLAALCNTFGVSIENAAQAELARITKPEMVEKIRAKQAAKPTGSALPAAVARSEPTQAQLSERIARVLDGADEIDATGALGTVLANACICDCAKDRTDALLGLTAVTQAMRNVILLRFPEAGVQ